MFLRARSPGQSAAGEPQTSSPLRQSAGPREGPSGGRRRQARAVVHINVFPVSREGKDDMDWTARCLLLIDQGNFNAFGINMSFTNYSLT